MDRAPAGGDGVAAPRGAGPGQWAPPGSFGRAEMDERVRGTPSLRYWPVKMSLVKSMGRPLHTLEVAEVGCGTGTSALVFALLGASVTLLDIDGEVLDQAGEMFRHYGCGALVRRADCLEEPGGELAGKFDVVMSGGLAEHFEAGDRLRCLRYHHALLREGGLACIGVPNRYSPFLRAVVSFRKWTGTFPIALEIPYSRAELTRLASEAGFSRSLVVGISPLGRDVFVYSRGLVSAAVDLLPAGGRNALRRWKRRNRGDSPGGSAGIPNDQIRGHCRDRLDSLPAGGPYRDHFWTDRFSSGLALLAVK